MWPLPPTYLCEPEPGPQLDSSLASDVLMQPALVAVLLPLHTPCPDPALHWCGSLRSCHPLVFAVGIKRLPFPRPRCWTLLSALCPLPPLPLSGGSQEASIYRGCMVCQASAGRCLVWLGTRDGEGRTLPLTEPVLRPRSLSRWPGLYYISGLLSAPPCFRLCGPLLGLVCRAYLAPAWRQPPP